MDYREKIVRVCRQLKEEGMDGLILSPSTDLTYMTEMRILSMERPVFLMILCGKTFFVMPEFELAGLKQKSQDEITYIGWREEENPYEKIGNIINESKLVVAIEPEMPVKMFWELKRVFHDWKWVSGDDIMSSLRSQKSDEEYHRLKEAHIRAGNAFEQLLQNGFAGKTEIQISYMLKRFMENEGLECDGLPLVAAGENSAQVHHSATDKQIKSEDVVLIDFGGKYKGYYSDITRTVVVDKPPEGFEEIYSIVRRANETVLKKARPEMSAEELDSTARHIIEQYGYGMYFTHRLGHGTGQDIHEKPYIVQGNKERLKEGNVFSNEPGIYLPGHYGVRLEDVLFLRRNGAECLTELSHDLKIVK